MQHTGKNDDMTVNIIKMHLCKVIKTRNTLEQYHTR